METLLNAIMKPFVKVYEAIPSPWNMIFAIVLGLIVGFFVLSVRRVPQDKKAIRMRWGAVVFDNNGKARIANPGFNVVVPWMWDYELVGTLDKTFDLGSITLRYSKYEVYTVKAMARFSVECVYGARFIVEDLPNAIASASADRLRSCLLMVPPSEIDAQRDQIDIVFAQKIKLVAHKLGTVFYELCIESIEPNVEALKAEAQMHMATSQNQIAQAIASLGSNTTLQESLGVPFTQNGNHPQ